MPTSPSLTLQQYVVLVGTKSLSDYRFTPVEGNLIRVERMQLMSTRYVHVADVPVENIDLNIWQPIRITNTEGVLILDTAPVMCVVTQEPA